MFQKMRQKNIYTHRGNGKTNGRNDNYEEMWRVIYSEIEKNGGQCYIAAISFLSELISTPVPGIT